MNKRNIALIVVAAFVGGLGFGQPADAASFKRLKAKGYKVGKLTRNRAGKYGWNVVKGDDKHFCIATLAVVDQGGDKGFGFTSSGRKIPLSMNFLRDYWKKRGKKPPRYPKWADVKAGRIDASAVGRCRKVR